MGEATRPVQVELPFHLCTLAGLAGRECVLEVRGEGTFGGLVDALEARYPALRGTVRDWATGQRRAYLRFFAGGQDVSFAGMEARLPEAVLAGREVLLVLGAVSGG